MQSNTPERFQTLKSLIVQGAKDFSRVEGHILAAGLAHFAILSIVPFLMFGTSLLEWLPGKSSATDMPEAYEAVARPIRAFLPVVDADLAQQVRGLVSTSKLSGITGLAAVLISASLFLSGLQHSLHNIFKPNTPRRGIIKKKLIVLGFVVFAVLLMAGIQLLWSVLPPDATVVLQSVFSSFVLTMAFVISIYWFGSRQLNQKNVLVGALFFCLFWNLALVCFRIYLDMNGSFSKIYGTLAGIAILMIWVYYASIIFIGACCLVNSLEKRRIHPDK